MAKRTRKHAKRRCPESAIFWRVMIWGIPLLISIGLAFYIYMLTSITEPIGGIKVEIEHLRTENEQLKEKIERQECELNKMKDTMLKMDLEIEFLYRDHFKTKNNLAVSVR